MTANQSKLNKQLLDMVKLSDYASAQEDLLNYKEALKAYKEIANIAKCIRRSDASAEVKTMLVPKIRDCINCGNEMKNIIFTESKKTKTKPNEVSQDNIVNGVCKDKVLQYLRSKEGCRITDKQREKIVNLACSLSFSKPKETFEDIVGSENAVLAAQESIVYTICDDFLRELRSDAPKGCLLYGQPGCGKTMLARACANCLPHVTFIEVRVTHIEDKYHGESEANVEAIFAIARILSPSIIFIGNQQSKSKFYYPFSVWINLQLTM